MRDAKGVQPSHPPLGSDDPASSCSTRNPPCARTCFHFGRSRMTHRRAVSRWLRCLGEHARGSVTPRPDRNVGVLIFDGVELLDFAGPFQVFADSRDSSNLSRRLFDVFTIAETLNPVATEAGVTVLPKCTIDECPQIDILIVPGGIGTRTAAFNKRIMSWIESVAEKAEVVISVCTGALLLGKAGLLDNGPATTHHKYFDMLRQVAKDVQLMSNVRFVDNGKVITAAGVSAGIDTALYVVARLHGVKQALHTAQKLEYVHWDPSTAAQVST